MKSATKTSVAWLNSRQAAVHMGFVDDAGNPNMRAFYRWKASVKPRTHKSGGALRFRQVDLDAKVEALPEVMAEDSPLVLIAGGKR